MGFYDDLRATAGRLIASKGMAMTLVSKSMGAYDTATGAVAETPTSSQVTGVSIEYPAKEVNGESVLRGDKRILLSATAARPRVTDELIVSGVKHKLMDCKTISPAGTDVMYIVQARAGV